jgi:hypothetical protein
MQSEESMILVTVFALLTWVGQTIDDHVLLVSALASHTLGEAEKSHHTLTRHAMIDAP